MGYYNTVCLNTQQAHSCPLSDAAARELMVNYHTHTGSSLLSWD